MAKARFRLVIGGCFWYMLLAGVAFAQQAKRNYTAVKFTRAPELDGKLLDECWQQVQATDSFVVNQPHYGTMPQVQARVKVGYTNQAIYFAAFIGDKPGQVRRQLTPRDGERMQDTDVFGVALDTYQDRQNAFQFNVTAANVQSDMRISPATENPDYSWDAVWDSRVHFQENGWSVEIMIPYMALRFSDKPVQEWGINFYLFNRRVNESSYWNPVNPGEGGFVNQFGNLLGLQNLEPPMRLSFLPYLSVGGQQVPTDGGSNFTTLKSGGLDVKYGVNEGFTLDMTLIPDFGQVVSDNVVLNLSPFEIQFAENRPFFTEGTELFNKAGIFYSRRVGATPMGYQAARAYAHQQGYTMVSNPGITRLYNASKFSGRNRKNLGIGIFNAIGARMVAEMKDAAGKKHEFETEPLTNYNIIVVDQAFKNRSSLTFTNTNVLRQGSARDANVSAVDVVLFDKKNTYQFVSSTRLSHVSGENRQTGYKAVTRFGRVSGKWQWAVENNIESKHYNPNDLGVLQAPNEFSTGVMLKFQQFAPNKHFNYRNYEWTLSQTNLYSPFKFSGIEFRSEMLHVFKNFWDLSVNVSSQPVWTHDYFEMRTPGVMVRKTPWVFLGLFGSTDSRKKLFVSYGGGFAEGPIENDPFFLLRGGVRYRFSNRFTLDASLRREHDTGNFGYAYRQADGTAILGRRELLNTTGVLSGIYNFTARMNLTLRARHYWSNVQYVAFFDVQPDGWWKNRPFTEGRDQNFNVFNVDAFFTWDFRLGSRLILAWKNALGSEEVIDGKRFDSYFSNLGQTLSSRHSNEVTIRFVYFLDYNQLKGKRLLKS